MTYTRCSEVLSGEKGMDTGKLNGLHEADSLLPRNVQTPFAKQRASPPTLRYCLVVRMPLIIVLVLAGCSSEPDWVMVSSRDIPSPDGSYVATVFEMCCHCTTGDFPQVSLRRPGEELGKRGNVLAGGPGDTFNARWLSATNLAVEYHVDGSWSSYPSTTNINGVTIAFTKL